MTTLELRYSPIIHTFAGLTPRQSIRAVLSGMNHASKRHRRDVSASRAQEAQAKANYLQSQRNFERSAEIKKANAILPLLESTRTIAFGPVTGATSTFTVAPPTFTLDQVLEMALEFGAALVHEHLVRHLIARLIARRPELAVRTALGATRADILNAHPLGELTGGSRRP